MKMVSQLTRQAMNRHRLLTNAISSEPMYIPQPATRPPLPPTLPPAPVQPALPVSSAVPPQPASQQVEAHSRPAQSSPRPHTVYQQLMKSHDRMTERHL